MRAGVNNIIFATLSERWKRERARADRARDEWMNAIALSLISKRETKTRVRACVSHIETYRTTTKEWRSQEGLFFFSWSVSFFEIFLAGSKHFGCEKTFLRKTHKAYTYTGPWKTIHMCINKRGIYMTTLAHSAVCSHLLLLLLLIRTTNYTTRRAKKKFSLSLSL